ncbi:hypothetical protein WMZ97_11045 [Lentibacillus sp. N15]|uniref:hypothetical protein n=1 Tax=Lentibacillus songyuanensis TaxID=3136161 RepID=UPI0031BA43D3
MNQEQLYHKIAEYKSETQQLVSQFWHEYSSIDTWYFWFNILSAIIPLVILYFAIDKKRIFEICFYGYTIHVGWANVDSILSTHNLLVHPHSLTYFIPTGLNMTAVVLPILFMLLYQYSTNRNKNVYLWSLIGCALGAFVFAPIMSACNLLKLDNGMNFVYVFLIDIAVSFFAYWLTLLFRWVKHRHTADQ